MIQALPKVSLNGQWLANKMEGNIKRLVDINFIVCGIVTDNHSTYISAFSNMKQMLHPNNHLKRT